MRALCPQVGAQGDGDASYFSAKASKLAPPVFVS